MNRYLVILFLLFAGNGFSQDVQFHYDKAREAFAARNYKTYYEHALAANKLHPYHQGLMYHLGVAAALNGDVDKAAIEINKALQIDAHFDLELEALAPFKEAKWLMDLKALQARLKSPIIHSDTAFVIPDRTAHIEAIAFDPISKSFFMGSIHKRKIIRRDASGKVTDFTKPGEHGLASIFGVKVDARKNILWASSSPMQEMENYDSTLRSAVYKFDLNSTKLLSRYETPAEVKESVFGDLILDKEGSVYVSDSRNNIIFKLNESTKKLEEYFHSDEFWNIQGITFSDDDRYLFISDYIKGLYQLEVATKKLTTVITPEGQSLKGIDGLLYYKGSLVTIQNGVNPFRVCTFKVDANNGKVSQFKMLDRAHPAFNEPTMGSIVGDVLYYVGNSQWSGYDEKRRIKAESELQDTVILTLDLKTVLSKAN